MHGKHDPADVARHDGQGTSGLSRIPALEFNTYLLAFMSSRTIIVIVPDLGYVRDRSINQQHEFSGLSSYTNDPGSSPEIGRRALNTHSAGRSRGSGRRG